MGLGLRRRICGRGWGRAPAPPSSAEGERYGCPGPSAAVPGRFFGGREGFWAGRTGRLWSTGTKPKRELGKAEGDLGGRVYAEETFDSCEQGPGQGVGKRTPVGEDGETPGGSGNEVLESEILAGIWAGVCGKATPGGLRMEIWGRGCGGQFLGVWGPWRCGVGVLVPWRGSRYALLVCVYLLGEDRALLWRDRGGQGRWTGRTPGWVRPGRAPRAR